MEAGFEGVFWVECSQIPVNSDVAAFFSFGVNSKKVLKGVLEFWLELGGFGVENRRFGSANLGMVGGSNSLGHVRESGGWYKSFAGLAYNYATTSLLLNHPQRILLTHLSTQIPIPRLSRFLLP